MKKFISFLIISSVLLASCKKDKTDVVAPGAPAVPSKKLAHSTMNGDLTLTYNADGTLRTLDKVVAFGPYHFTTTYSYSPGKVNYLAMLNGKKSEIGEYTIVNGRPTTFVWTYFDAFENPLATYTETFKYNAKGLLAEHQFGPVVHTLYTYDANDNLVTAVYYNDQGIAESKTEYTYGNQKDLFPAMNYMSSDGEGFLLPAYSKYLPVTQKGTNLLTNTIEFENSFTYTLDADGYVIKGKSDAANPAHTDYEWISTFQ